MKEPIASHTIPAASWESVSIDLFGPMPDHKHVLVVTDLSSRFPAAKVVSSTAAKPVMKPLDNIYTDYGQPLVHRTDNGPPFNSDEFKRYSTDKGIEHVRTYPYHPAVNLAETFMKPLGKTMKSVHYNNSDKEEALKELLSSYRATPHPATGEAPGAILFRSGYRHDFPRKTLTEQEVNEASIRDENQRILREQVMNKSSHRTKSKYLVGDRVYKRNPVRNKFQPNFGPDTYKIVCIGRGGATLQHEEDNHIITRHLDDIKPAPQCDNNVLWFPEDVYSDDQHTVTTSVTTDNDPSIETPAEQSYSRPHQEHCQPSYLIDYIMHKE